MTYTTSDPRMGFGHGWTNHLIAQANTASELLHTQGVMGRKPKLAAFPIECPLDQRNLGRAAKKALKAKRKKAAAELRVWAPGYNDMSAA